MLFRSRAEVAGVDTDKGRSEIEGTRHFVTTVGLDQCRHPELADEIEQLLHGTLLESRNNQQDEVGPGSARFEHLIGVGDEVFAKNWQRHGIPNRFEISEGAAETTTLGEHTDRTRSTGLIRRGEGGGIGDVCKGTTRRACALDLGDDFDAVGGSKQFERIEGSGTRQRCSLNDLEAGGTAAFRSVLQGSGYEIG